MNSPERGQEKRRGSPPRYTRSDRMASRAPKTSDFPRVVGAPGGRQASEFNPLPPPPCLAVRLRSGNELRGTPRNFIGITRNTQEHNFPLEFQRNTIKTFGFDGNIRMNTVPNWTYFSYNFLQSPIVLLFTVRNFIQT